MIITIARPMHVLHAKYMRERNLEVIEENFETLCMVILRGLDFLESVLDSRKSCREVERRA